VKKKILLYGIILNSVGRGREGAGGVNFEYKNTVWNYAVTSC
jgi:hypothetical protein